MFKKNPKEKRSQHLLLTDTIVTATGFVHIAELKLSRGMMMETFIEVTGIDKHGHKHTLTFDWGKKVTVK